MPKVILILNNGNENELEIIETDGADDENQDEEEEGLFG